MEKILNSLENVKKSGALVHNITNYVTVNDCANILLAIGAQPIMADDENEVEDITSICSGLNINIGTLNTRTINSMLISGKKSNELGHVTCLDPVGVGASKLRNDTTKTLLENVKFDLICGNISEIKSIALNTNNTSGVDASDLDKVNSENINEVISFSKQLSKNTGAIIAISGATDIICDQNNAYVITNGINHMSKVTGTGCMLSAMSCAFLAANVEHKLEAAVASVLTMTIAGELAWEKVEKLGLGNSSYRNFIIDEVFNMDKTKLKQRAKYEVR